ncbi:hypothetical protein GE09DRAFT_1059724 [Coniochaeta sp. 2T2.1]|nr:hypothetical protein GE09DRAFT_1059724 [Coniochaeta sp. 2T2.1]
MRLTHNILLGLQLATAVSGATTPCKQHGCPCPTPHKACAEQVADSKWVVEHFSYNASYIFTTPAHQNSHGYVSFDVFNTAAPSYTATCSASSSQLTDFFYGTQWYTCALPPTAPAGASLQFKFNRPTGDLGLNATIICPGRGHGTGSEHHVEATTHMSLACIDMTWTNPNYTFPSGEFYSDREVKCVPDSCVV